MVPTPKATPRPTKDRTPSKATPGPPDPLPNLTPEPASIDVLRRRVQRPIDRILKRLPLTNIAFTAPTSLRLDETTVVELRMSDQESITELKAELRDVGMLEGAQVRASNRMEATLTGIDFKIQQVTPTQQPVGAITEWQWQVQPTATGKRHLDLTLTALVAIEGEQTRYAVRTFERTLEVRATPVTQGTKAKRFFESNWQWLWTALIIPLVAWYGRRRATRRSAEETNEHTKAKV